MLWAAGDGIGLLEDHLARLRSSARYFAVPFDETLVRERLADASREFGTSGGTGASGAPRLRVRLLLARDGSATIEAAPLQPLRADDSPVVRIAVEPIDPHDTLLYHKTTVRRVYDRARALAGQCDDVILWNNRNEITESCIANVVVEIGGTLFTPPVSCGLLPGVSRTRMLRAGAVRERIILVDDLRRAERIFLTNAVRGRYEVRLVG
jgi:para-aminobenzoate synthetase/4-amino-4-deoxychorismate lyase